MTGIAERIFSCAGPYPGQEWRSVLDTDDADKKDGGFNECPIT